MVRRGTVAALCAAALVLVGCSDDPPKPKPLDPPSSSTSASPTGGTTSSPDAPVEPAMPAAARKLTEPGAKAFVRYFYEVQNYAMKTGDTERLRSLSTDQCDSCQNVADRIDEIYGDGGTYRTEGWNVEAVRPGPSHTSAQPDFLLRVRQTPADILDADGAVVEHIEMNLQSMRLVLAKRGDAWKVLEGGKF